jgi:hypothetical protein
MRRRPNCSSPSRRVVAFDAADTAWVSVLDINVTTAPSNRSSDTAARHTRSSTREPTRAAGGHREDQLQHARPRVIGTVDHGVTSP